MATPQHITLPQNSPWSAPLPNQMASTVTALRWQASLGLGLVLLLVCLAIWVTPWFLTQDGAAHLYNAQILVDLQKGEAPFDQVYQAHWQPLPNLAGHVLLMGLLAVFPDWLADRLLITLTLVALAVAAMWLRVQVAGWYGALGAVPLAGLLALNWMWLMGFYNFLLGAALFAVTLGCWWRWHQALSGGRAAGLTLLLVLGYFCHLFSLGLTVVGLGVLTLLTPGTGWWGRTGWTVLSGVPLLPLLWFYRNLAQRDVGPVQASWKGMNSFWSLREWLVRWQGTETLQLGGRKFLPFSEAESLGFVLASPTVLAAVGIGLLLLTGVVFVKQNWQIARLADRPVKGAPWWHAQRGWLALTGLLILGCAFAPDQLGDRHGGFIRQRLLLLALLTLLPLLPLHLTSLTARWGKALLALALALQVLWVWDYARTTNRIISEFLQVRQVLAHSPSTEKFVGTVLLPEVAPPAVSSVDSPIRYRWGAEQLRYTARPLLHADDLLGVGARTIVWNNYEATQYYFPVKHQNRAANLLARDLDLLNKRSLPKTSGEAKTYLQDWLSLFAQFHQEMPILLVWGAWPELERQLGQWYKPEPLFAAGRVRLFQHK